MRSELLTLLRTAKVTQVIASYSGSEDEGLIDDVEGAPGELADKLDDFFWDVLCDSSQSGFWNGDGGGGTLVWDIATDKIIMNHYNNLVTTVDCLPEIL